MGNFLCCQNNQNVIIVVAQQKMTPKYTKSSMQDLLVNGLVANTSSHKIKFCIMWNEHKLQGQLIGKKLTTGAGIGFKNFAPQADFHAGGQYTVQQNRKKYDKMARHTIQPSRIKKFQIRKDLLSSCSISISIILENKQQRVLDEISVNCIQDLQWIILSDSTCSKMSKKQYEFINTNYQKGYYDPRNSCKHREIRQIDNNNVQGCFCCLKLKQLTIGGNRWHLCNTCLKIYCDKCYKIKKHRRIVVSHRLQQSQKNSTKIIDSCVVSCLSQSEQQKQLEQTYLIKTRSKINKVKKFEEDQYLSER